VSSSTVAPGGSITVSDSGWKPDTAVDLKLHSNPVDLGSAQVGAKGTFETTVTIPSDTTLGTHDIVIAGTLASGEQGTHTVAVTVVTPTTTTIGPFSTPTTEFVSGNGSSSSSGSSGSLPKTGSSTQLPAIGLGMVLVGSGLGIAIGRRRRRA
jgi:LPXTG-motif cell wall-anchored protein